MVSAPDPSTPEGCFGRFIENGCFHIYFFSFFSICCYLCVSTSLHPPSVLGDVAGSFDLVHSVVLCFFGRLVLIVGDAMR